MATIHVAVEATSNTEAKWGGRGYHPAPTSQVLSRRDRLRVWRRRGAPSFSRRSATTLVPSSAARTRPRLSVTVVLCALLGVNGNAIGSMDR